MPVLAPWQGTSEWFESNILLSVGGFVHLKKIYFLEIGAQKCSEVEGWGGVGVHICLN